MTDAMPMCVRTLCAPTGTSSVRSTSTTRLWIQTRELYRADEVLRSETNRLKNRSRDQLSRWVPHVLSLSPSVDEPWFWDLVEYMLHPGSVLTVDSRL